MTGSHVRAIETAFSMTRNKLYPVDNGAFRDDGGLRRDASGLVGIGVAVWADEHGCQTAAPVPARTGQHFAGVYDTELPILVAFARNRHLPLAMLVDGGNAIVNLSVSPWAGDILLGCRHGIQTALARLGA